MGSGEGDAVRKVVVDTSETLNNKVYGYVKSLDTNSSISTTTAGSALGGYYDGLGVWHDYNYTPTMWSYSWPSVVYKYQVKCPVKVCKKMNWLELDKISPCIKCGTKLKAVSEQADFEIPVEK